MNNELLYKQLKELNYDLTDEKIQKLEKYKQLIIEWNKKFNLTNIIQNEDMNLKHILDSAYLIKTEKLKDNIKLCDIGTGAGLPGIIISILMPNIEISLIESNSKKCTFLETIKKELNLNIKIYNDRAEEHEHKEYYDIVTSRAVAPLYILSELSLPLINKKGYFIPMKANLEEELNKSKKHIKKLNGIIEKQINYKLPIENSKRTIMLITKELSTPPIYPRNYSKIKKEYKNIEK